MRASHMQRARKVIGLLKRLIKTDRHACGEIRRTFADVRTGEAEAEDGLCEFARHGRSRVYELRAEIRALGEDPGADRDGSWLQCQWMRLRQRFDPPNEYARMGRCLTHLEADIDAYLDTLEHHLPNEVRLTLERQFREACAAYDTLDAMHHAGRGNSSYILPIYLAGNHRQQ